MIRLLLLAAQSFPAPAADPNEAKLGYGIQRTMSLLASSTPQSMRALLRPKLKLMHVGPSILNGSRITAPLPPKPAVAAPSISISMRAQRRGAACAL